MKRGELKLTYIGGPTILLEWIGFRILTDPTFDPAGTEYSSGSYKYRKTAGPALPAESIGRKDAIILSHDHHFDNLDQLGRALLPTAGMVLTTPAGAERLGGNAKGIRNWETLNLSGLGKQTLTVTGTPAMHGPEDRGPVTGFILQLAIEQNYAIYVSGDTIWYEGVSEVAKRYPVRVAALFMGAAHLPEIGAYHLTMTAQDAIQAARACPQAVIVPLHYEGWTHYSESRTIITRAFRGAGLSNRVSWLKRGKTSYVPI